MNPYHLLSSFMKLHAFLLLNCWADSWNRVIFFRFSTVFCSRLGPLRKSMPDIHPGRHVKSSECSDWAPAANSLRDRMKQPDPVAKELAKNMLQYSLRLGEDWIWNHLDIPIIKENCQLGMDKSHEHRPKMACLISINTFSKQKLQLHVQAHCRCSKTLATLACINGARQFQIQKEWILSSRSDSGKGCVVQHCHRSRSKSSRTFCDIFAYFVVIYYGCLLQKQAYQRLFCFEFLECSHSRVRTFHFTHPSTKHLPNEK